MAQAPASDFDVRFLWSMRDVAGDEAYAVFLDDRSDPFAQTLIQAARPDAPLVVATARLDELPGDRPVFMEAPVWRRNQARLAAAGIGGDRLRVLLYFDHDPTGYWDFAKACGPELSRLFQAGQADVAALGQLQPYLETWLGARVSQGRLAPLPAFTARDYPDLVAGALPRIARVMRALADDESRATYARVLFGRTEDLLAGFIQRVFGPQQYMEIVRLRPGDVVVNCGVERGWELPYFICRMQGQGRILSFDPHIDWASTRYGDFIESFRDMLSEARIVLGAHDGTVDLPTGPNRMVRSDARGEEMAAAGAATARYDCRTLDSLVAERGLERLDYLKMDVEGAERAILEGGLTAIRRFRPKLAVATYHEPEHFWEYPEFLLNHLDGYRYYLRQYGYGRFETLLYAVPDEEVESGSGAEAWRAAPPSSTPPGAALALHLRDRAPRERHHAGPRRALTRVSGRLWRTAALDPAPQLEVDAVVAVFEGTGEDTAYLVRHAYSPADVQVLAAVATGPAAFAWTASKGIAPTMTCAPAPGPAGEPGYALHDPAEERVWVFRLDTQGFEGVASAEAAHPPVLVEREAGGLTVAHLEADGRALVLQRFRGETAFGAPYRLALPAPFAGFGVAGEDDPAIRRACILIQRSEAPIEAVDILGRRLGALDGDARFAVVSTFRAGAVSLTQALTGAGAWPA